MVTDSHQEPTTDHVESIVSPLGLAAHSVLPVSVNAEAGDELRRPTVGELATLVFRLGDAEDNWIVVKPHPFRPNDYIQSYREGDGVNQVEMLQPGRPQMGVEVDDPEDLLRLLCEWAEDRPAWRAREWRPTGFVPQRIAAPDPKVKARAEERARDLLAQGYWSYDGIAAALAELAEPDGSLDTWQAEELLEPLWLERLSEQEKWPELTDCDRLSAAFTALADVGVTARENFACCMSCGVAEIRSEAAETDHGYTFFHQQDTGHVAEGEPLHLGFGAYSGDPETAATVARQVVAALEEHGLTAEWDGEVSSRIVLPGLQWRRRVE
ncbi:hypothetical protein GCM10023223_17070 [Stackebrandtia albiflava]